MSTPSPNGSQAWSAVATATIAATGGVSPAVGSAIYVGVEINGAATVTSVTDDAGNVYVNTTSGNPDDIKYSRQIDVSKHTDDVLLKLDPKNGRTLWSIKPGGFISYLKGKFIYAVQAYDPNPTDEDIINDMAASLQKPPFLRIIRINPKNGRIMWDYYDRDRCPIDVRFNENSIELVFKREVQVLRYLTF